MDKFAHSEGLPCMPCSPSHLLEMMKTVWSRDGFLTVGDLLTDYARNDVYSFSVAVTQFSLAIFEHFDIVVHR